MTTLVEDLQSLLNPLATGGAWYGANTQQPPVLPYIVFQRITSTANVALGGSSAMQNTRVQIDIYAERQSDCESVEQTIESAFSAWPTWQNVPLLSQDFYEQEVRLYRVSKDYSVWSTN